MTDKRRAPRAPRDRHATGFFDRAEPAECARRGPAEGDALLPGAVSATSVRRSRSSAPGILPPRPRSTAIATAREVTLDRSVAGACPTRSSTGSSRTSRTASRKAASARYFNTAVEEIRAVIARACARRQGASEIENDWVLAMTGYRPDYGFLEALGSAIARRPVSHAGLRRRPRSRPAGRASTLRAPCAAAADRPLVHRERPVSRAADREAHRARERRADPVRSRCTGRRRSSPADQLFPSTTRTECSTPSSTTGMSPSPAIDAIHFNAPTPRLTPSGFSTTIGSSCHRA